MHSIIINVMRVVLYIYIHYIADFKKELDEQFSAAYTGVEASVFSTYEQVNQSIEDKLQELYAVLDRIGTSCG